MRIWKCCGRVVQLTPVAGFALFALLLPLFTSLDAHAQPTPPGGDTNTYYYGTPLDAWSFNDTSNWTTDFGYASASFTNIDSTLFGDGIAVVVDSTNSAWLQYNVLESDGTTNLTVDTGSVILWFAPHWSSTNEDGGTGPQTWGRLLEVGSTNGSGLWSLYVDPDGVNVYFTVQTNGGDPVTYLSAPIDWVTNEWHQLAITYSATNTILYLDGWNMTNGPAITNFPGSDVLTNGFFIGSDSAGNNQAHGMFDDIYTYNYPVNRDVVSGEYMTAQLYLMLNPYNRSSFISSAPSTPQNIPTFNAIAGPGFLQWQGVDSDCSTGSSVLIKNVTATGGTNNTMNVTFTITSGTAGWWYDVFATTALASPITNATWAWMGQGTNCGIYSLTLSNTQAFFILGTPLDSDGDGLTDAYEQLVSHTDPSIADSSGDGLLDGWEVMWSLNALQNNPAQSNLRSNYGYDLADWLTGVSGVRTGSITTDDEGNVLSVSQ
jgi:hypothetical protein